MTAPPRCPTCGLPRLQVYVGIRALAQELGVTQRHLLRVIRRLGMRRYRMRRGRHPRLISVIALGDAVRLAGSLPRTDPVKSFVQTPSPMTLTSDLAHI